MTVGVVEDLAGSVVTTVAPGGAGDRLVVGTDRGVAFVDVDGQVTWISALRGAHVVAASIEPSGSLAVADVGGRLALVGPGGSVVDVDMGTRVRSLAWSSTGSTLAVCSQVGGLVVLDRQGRRRCGLVASRRWRHVCWTGARSGAPLLGAGAGGVWWLDPDQPDPVVRHDPSGGVVTAVAVDRRGGRVAFGDLRGEVRMRDLRTEDVVEVAGWPDPVELVAWVPDPGPLLVAGGDEVTAWRLDLPEDEEDLEPERVVLGGRVTALAPHPWDARAAIGGDDGSVLVWSSATGEHAMVPGARAEVTALAWDTLGERLFVGTRDGGTWLTVTGGGR